MTYLLKDYALLLTVRGAMAVLFGIVAVTHPEPSLFSLALLFSALMLMDSIQTLFTGIALNPDYEGWWAAVLEGGCGFLFGLMTLFWPEISETVLFGLVAGWVLITGIFMITAGMELRRIVGGEWLMIPCGVLTVILSALWVAFPGQPAVTLLWMAGVYAIVSGSARIIDAIRLYSRLHRLETVSA